jgi:hypothetical protein
MSNDIWRWADPDGQQRRVRLDELRAALAGGLIAPNAPVWKPGWPKWQAAHEVPELTSASLGGAHGVVLNIPPPPLAMVAVQQSYEKQSESMAPAPASLVPAGPEPEPPVPPPRYVPVAAKMPSMSPSPSSSVSLPTMIGGSSGMVRAAAAVPAPAPSAPAPPVAVPAPVSTRPGLGKNIPTTLGMPSPLLAPPTGVPLGAPESVEELSARHLIDPGSEPTFNPVPAPAPMPPPSDPVVVQPPLFTQDDEPVQVVGPSIVDQLKSLLEQLIADLKGLKEKQPPKNLPLVIGAGVLALMVVIGFFAIIIGLASGGSSSAKTVASASASSAPSAKMAPPPTTIASAVTTATTPAVVTPPPSPTSSVVLGECKIAGDPKVIAPRAVSAAAIEGQALGSGLAFGFAASSRDAVATMIDPATFAPTATVRTKPGGDVKRVTPFLNNGKLAALVDSDRKGDKLASRRSVATSPLVDVGVADGALVWAPHGRDSSAKLFSLDGDSPVEALRAIPLADHHGIAVTFRRDNAIRIGVARGENTLEADGELSKIDGLGPAGGTLGSPSIASSGDRVVVAWADRTTNDTEWGVRWTTVKPHTTQTSASALIAPPGGPAGNVMSPAVASLGGGRFLLAWTEGTTTHAVRALTFAADGTPSPMPLEISGSSDNAGQPAIALNDDGKGFVAYLAAKGNKGFELHVTPISCPRQ